MFETNLEAHASHARSLARAEDMKTVRGELYRRYRSIRPGFVSDAIVGATFLIIGLHLILVADETVSHRACGAIILRAAQWLAL
jgi:hypothetical protein